MTLYLEAFNKALPAHQPTELLQSISVVVTTWIRDVAPPIYWIIMPDVIESFTIENIRSDVAITIDFTAQLRQTTDLARQL